MTNYNYINVLKNKLSGNLQNLPTNHRLLLILVERFSLQFATRKAQLLSRQTRGTSRFEQELCPRPEN